MIIFVRLRHSAMSGIGSPQVASASSTAGFRKVEIATPEAPTGIDQKHLPIKSKEERNLEIRKRFANGETQRKIAKDFGLTQSGVEYICKGVERKTGRKRLSKQAREERNKVIWERFANKEKQKAIANDNGISQVSVSRICKGVKRKDGRKRLNRQERKERNQRIRKRNADGEELKVIAKDYGLTKSRVGQICKGVERKVKPKPKNEERDQAIRERFANGETLKVIAKDSDLSIARVGKICKGVERKVKPKRESKPINE